jgi:hypothetical protein
VAGGENQSVIKNDPIGSNLVLNLDKASS